MMKKNLLILATVFFIAFLWGLFFTYGFHFFWEDFSFYRLDKEIYPLGGEKINLIPAILRITSGFIKNAFSFGKLFQISFSGDFTDRPYQYLTWDTLRFLFSDNVVFYRIFKAIIFALNSCFIFIIVKRISLVFAIFSVGLYISSVYEWLALVYSCDVGIYSQLAMLTATWLFLKLIESNASDWKKIWLYYFLIFAFSNYAILAKFDGRYLAAIFLLTIIFFYKEKIRYHILPLFILLILEIPVFGFIKKIISKTAFNPIFLMTHNPMPFWESLANIIQKRNFMFEAIGKPLLVLLCLSLLIHLFCLFFRKLCRNFSDDRSPLVQVLRGRSFLFMLWTAAALIMIAAGRSFNYDGPNDLQLIDFEYLIVPLSIFISYLVFYSYKKIRKPFNVIFLVISIVLIMGQIIIVNLIRLNRFRGGWGNYFCAWQNAERYIEKNYDNALALSVNAMAYKPFVFRNSNNKVLNTLPPAEHSPFCDLKYVENKFREGYKDIFVLGWGKLNFRGESKNVILFETKIFDGDSGDLYDLLKRVMKRPSRPELYLYHFRYKK